MASCMVLRAIFILGASALFALHGHLTFAQAIVAVPDPVPVHLDATTTALLVLDLSEPPCGSLPACTEEVVPAVVPLLARARAAGALVVFSAGASTTMLPD